MRKRVFPFLAVILLVLMSGTAFAEISRISASDARFLVKTNQALLVCAYDDVQRCAENRLEGSLDVMTLRRVRPALRRDFTIIFYCT